MIRNFEKSDIDEIYKLGNLLNSSFSKTNNLLDIAEDKYTKILIYESENIIKGFLMYTELEAFADINDIIVREEYRNKRIASSLIDYMISNLQDSVKLITLEVRESNIKAINLYQKFGFNIVNIRKSYYNDNEDAYLMKREC